MSDKDLKYYQNLEYGIRIELTKESEHPFYMAYCDELGKYACYGRGETQMVAIQEFLEEKNSFIEYLFNSGETIPEPKGDENERFSGFFNVRTSPIIHALLVSQSKELGISLNLYLNQILSAATEKKGIENCVLDKLSELCGKLDNHHFEVTRQLRYQSDTISKQFKWKLEYSNPYLEVV